MKISKFNSKIKTLESEENQIMNKFLNRIYFQISVF